MTTWTFLAMDTPLNGSAQRSELTMASSRSMEFPLNDSCSLTFRLPGRHWQTSLVEPLTTDILVYRDDWPVQRFRVVSAQWDKSGGDLTASYECKSYDELLNAWIFHTDHVRSFTATEQTAIAWAIIDETQDEIKGDLGLSRGTMPTTPVTRTLDGDWDGAAPDPYYFAVGKKKGEAVRDIAAMINGFEWSIEPDRTSATTALSLLKFNVWNLGLRKQFTPRCPFILDDGGNVSSWRRQDAPSEYANVVYGIGSYPTGVATGTDQPPVSWEPDDMNPTGAAPEGRWERAVPFDTTSQEGTDDTTEAELVRRLGYQPAWSVELAPGRWQGPDEMWVGDYCRMAISDGPIEFDDDVRVVNIHVSVDDDGAEVLKLELDRPARTYEGFRADLQARLLRLETR